MHLTRPPQPLRRAMCPVRPIPAFAGELPSGVALPGVAGDETERSFMDRILTCDRLAWEAAERCAAARREHTALLRAQTAEREAGDAAHPDPLREVRTAQLERSRERLEAAELSYRITTQLLRETITEALASRVSREAIARAVEPQDEPEISGGVS